MLKILRPIFEDLSKEELLKQCLHGKTQNANESFNNIVWLKCPKTVFVNRQNIELGINSAILQFNDGAHGIINVLEQFSIRYGIYIYIGSSKKDETSIRWSSTKSSEARKKNVNNYMVSKKVLLIKIMNKKKLLMFLVDFKVIYAVYITFVTLCKLIFVFF